MRLFRPAIVDWSVILSGDPLVVLDLGVDLHCLHMFEQRARRPIVSSLSAKRSRSRPNRNAHAALALMAMPSQIETFLATLTRRSGRD